MSGNAFCHILFFFLMTGYIRPPYECILFNNETAIVSKVKAYIIGTFYFTKDRCEIKEIGVTRNLVQVTFPVHPLLFPIYLWKLRCIVVMPFCRNSILPLIIFL